MQRLKINQLRLLKAIGEKGRITDAAEELSITQPAASRLLSEMEATLDAKLCIRHPKGLELTLIGRAITRRAQNILVEMQGLTRDVEELKAGKGGVTRIGAVTGAAVGYVVPAVQQLKAVSPRTEIHVSVSTSSLLMQQLLAGELDCILGRVPLNMDPSQFDLYQAHTEKIDLIVRKDHPLSSAISVSLTDLTYYDWIIQNRGNPIREATEAAFLRQAALLPARVTNTSSLLVTLAILANSTAISPIAREVSELLTGPSVDANIAILPLNEEIELDPYHLITVKGRQLSPAANQLKQLVIQELDRVEKYL